MLKYLKQLLGRFVLSEIHLFSKETIYYLCLLFQLKECSINAFNKHKNYFPYINTYEKKQVTPEIHLNSTGS